MLRQLVSTSLLSLVIYSIDSHAQQSHCAPSEKVIFSCKIKHSAKTVSLCATSDQYVGDKVTGLVYVFGRIGQPELRFPDQQLNSLEKFRLSHYLRPGLDATTITFSKGGFEYSVYETVEEYAISKGVTVDAANKSSIALECAAPTTKSNWSAISGEVPCDESDGFPNSCEYHPK